MDNTIQKLVCINHIKLPHELLNIVKSYAFYNINKEKKKHSILYSHVINDVNRSKTTITYWSNNCYYFFMSPNREIILNTLYCNDCGQYLMADSQMYRVISCFCTVNQELLNDISDNL